MNKQEAIEKIKRRTEYFKVEKEYNRGFRDGLNNSISVIREIDEPEKPVVPQFVADFYESIKDDFEDKVYDLCVRFSLDESELNSDVAQWFDCSKNKPIETLVLMHKFGYEIRKGKLYTVRNKTTGEYLYFDESGKRYESGTLLTRCAQNIKGYHHTQDTLEKLNYWGNPLFEFEEMEK